MTLSRRNLRNAAGVLAVAAAIYLGTAYILLPAIWADYEHQPGLKAQPMVTTTAQGIPGGPLNVGLVGSRIEVMSAMAMAGWHPADPITLRTSLDIGISVALGRPYPEAPVSNLYYDGRKQDLAFEMPVGLSPARRHHIRFWLALSDGTEGRAVWLGAASFDRSVGFSHDTGQITHHIDADLDAERAFFLRSLGDVGVLDRTYRVAGIGPTLAGRNGGGDRYFTDGEVAVGVIRQPLDTSYPPEKRALPAAPSAKDRIWDTVVAVGRFLRALPQPRQDGS